MQQPIIAVYDKKIGSYEKPFVAKHTGEAIRDFDHVRKDPQTKFGRNPEDFDLFHIGQYDETSGKLISLEPHIHLASGV